MVMSAQYTQLCKEVGALGHPSHSVRPISMRGFVVYEDLASPAIHHVNIRRILIIYEDLIVERVSV